MGRGLPCPGIATLHDYTLSSLVSLLPPERRDRLITGILASQPEALYTNDLPLDFLWTLQKPWTIELCRAVLKSVAHHIKHNTPKQSHWQVSQSLSTFAYSMPPSIYLEAERTLVTNELNFRQQQRSRRRIPDHPQIPPGYAASPPTVMTSITPTPSTNPVTQNFLSLKLNQRRAYLCDLRETDPAAALRLVQSVWTQSDAKSRKTYIRTFHTGVSMADEPFLESALDDRGRRVRGAAAYLLANLPGSRLLQRFTDHAVNHLDYLIHMRPNTPDEIHITFPTAYTPAMKRDGILEKPDPPVIGAPAYWLFQELGHIPLQTWTERWNKTPNQIINAALNSGEYSQYLLTAWITVIYTYKDPDWAEAVLAHNFEEIVPITPQHLLNLVAPDRREQIVQNNLANHPGLLHAPGTPIYMLSAPRATMVAPFLPIHPRPPRPLRQPRHTRRPQSKQRHARNSQRPLPHNLP